ncbi:hypothetical protein ACH49M_32150 [Rhodococcus qingshengii]|uniref:Uncharacterized protein n=1 Tax=Rhodococcus baikonurensis TaxID=172041 RepID=A0ABV5XEY4_9NOCA|nr:MULTISPECIES: hypothetical protein [Rhodococcus]NHP18624.1 hypothetical protein [Rhodococcus sp. IC4_135]MBP1054784.1 hypothetical protein [Rhodococcus qingshengii]MCZ4548014.1 hypothetical protein [Rhodococcus qingshengii]QEM25441.1 hypothetical protein D6M20_00880 [Rhodococcus qingshengii]UGQ55626.1 hypothetical protein LRL17_32475 [Rhodococcus qingshengii]
MAELSSRRPTARDQTSHRRAAVIAAAPRGAAMAFSEHYDTMPQQTYTWSSSIKPEASQQNPNSAKLRTFLES